MAARSEAGGFLMPEGQGQIIAGVGYIAAPRTFDRTGKTLAAPAFRKAEIDGFIEYGLTSGLTLIAAPTIARLQAGSASNAYSGSDESAFGARLKLWGTDARTLAIQALIEPPLSAHSGPTQAAPFGGPNAFAADMRLQLAQSVAIGQYPGYLSLEPGVRFRSQGWPNEAHLDVAFGVRPWPRSLVLVQGFASNAPRAGPLIPHTAYAKLQLSFVYDLTTRWSLQIGGIHTVIGRNAAQETGPLFALWYRF